MLIHNHQKYLIERIMYTTFIPMMLLIWDQRIRTVNHEKTGTNSFLFKILLDLANGMICSSRLAIIKTVSLLDFIALCCLMFCF